MSKQVSHESGFRSQDKYSIEEFHVLSLDLLQQASLGGSTSDFLRRCIEALMKSSGCDVIGIHIADEPVNCYAEKTGKQFESYTFTATIPGVSLDLSPSDDNQISDPSFKKLISGKEGMLSRFVTPRGSLWINNTIDFLREYQSVNPDHQYEADQAIEYRSMALIHITVAGRKIGHVQMKCTSEQYFTTEDVEFYERISDFLSTAIVSHRAQIALGERVKELSCLYNIARIAADPEFLLDGILRNVVELLPPAWQYPEITQGCILLDGQHYSTHGFTGVVQSQAADIFINGKCRGIIEVGYIEVMPELDEGPFLREERNLIDAIGRLIAQIIEKKQAEEDRKKLQDQLRHADRLATIGQLAAGVAHEFNEPLGNVLGFAQLILKDENLPSSIKTDIDKIVTASMHARQVVKKLMMFARQMPAEKTWIDLNKVIDEGLYFLETRCAKAGINMVRLLSPELPEIFADQSQMHQVLVNLVVNAIQAMPNGGTITLFTERLDKNICLRVSDTGDGMSEEILEKLFVPFFTTKDVNEGTGLGLPVVHGIVTSHGGSIIVTSQVGSGTSFEIQLPITGPGEVKVTAK